MNRQGLREMTLCLHQGELHIQRRVKVVSLLGNSIKEGEVLFIEGVGGS
jgi:hypothetical protein